MERKDWLYTGLLLTIILLLVVVICNQFALEEELNEQSNRIIHNVKETATTLDCRMTGMHLKTYGALFDIGKSVGMTSEDFKDWNAAADGIVENHTQEIRNYYYYGVTP